MATNSDGARNGRTVRLVTALVLAVAVTACGDDDATEGEGPSGSDTASDAHTADTAETTVGAADSTETARAGEGDTACTPELAGGEVTISQPLFARGLDPTINLGSAVAGGTELTAIYDTLLRFNPDTGDYEPHLAESFEGNADSTEWTVTLREGVTFGNGDPVTAEAVRYSIERMKEGTASSSGLAQQVVEMNVVDDRTIELRLDEPWGSFPYVLSEEAGMVVNPAVVDSLAPDEFNIAPPEGAGAGPYVVDRFVPDEEIVLTAKDDYWGGPVCIETLRFVPISGDQAKYDAFTTGELTMAVMTDNNVIAEAQDADVPGYGQRAGIGTMIAVNHADPELEDVRIRRALAMAIDHETLNQRVFAGNAEAASALMPADSPVYGGPGPSYDPDQAASLVEEAKADGWDGTLRMISTNNSEDQETLLTVEGMLEQVGFEIEAEALESSEVNRRIISDQTYQTGLYGPAALEESVVNDFVQFVGGSPSNRLNIADPDLDDAIRDLVAARGRDESRAAMEEIQQVWNEIVPAVNLFMVDWWFAVAPEVEGITWTRDVVPMFHTAHLADG